MLERLLLLLVPLRPTAELLGGRVEDAQIGRFALADSARDVGVALRCLAVPLPHRMPRPLAYRQLAGARQNAIALGVERQLRLADLNEGFPFVRSAGGLKRIA